MVFMYWFAFSSGGVYDNSITFFGVKYNYLQWLLIGVLTWTYIGDILLTGPTAIKNYTWISKSFGISPHIPPIFVNISRFLVGSGTMLVGFVISMILNGIEGNPVVTWSALEIPVVFILMFAFMLSWSYLLAPIIAISRDMQNIILIIPVILSWVSGVFIQPTGALSGDSATNVTNLILQINPFNFLISGARSSMMGFGSIFVPNIYNEWYSIVSFFSFTALFFGLGYIFNHSTKRFLLDII